MNRQSPLEGRKHHLQTLWQVVGKVFKGKKDTINEWNDLIDTFPKDKSKLEDDEKWYRIRTALRAALVCFFLSFLACSEDSEMTHLNSDA